MENFNPIGFCQNPHQAFKVYSAIIDNAFDSFYSGCVNIFKTKAECHDLPFIKQTIQYYIDEILNYANASEDITYGFEWDKFDLFEENNMVFLEFDINGFAYIRNDQSNYKCYHYKERFNLGVLPERKQLSENISLCEWNEFVDDFFDYMQLNCDKKRLQEKVVRFMEKRYPEAGTPDDFRRAVLSSLCDFVDWEKFNNDFLGFAKSIETASVDRIPRDFY